MSRASGASFAQFFPSAPRAAKDKAKEREKSSKQTLDSPTIRAIADRKTFMFNSRIDNASSPSAGVELHPPPPPSAPSAHQAEDNESIQGDILNGVGSAGSDMSTVSSVFSAPPSLQSNIPTFGASRNMSSLTPLTSIDSSPTRITSPSQYKLAATVTTAISHETVADNHDLQPPAANAEPFSQVPRILARDPSRGSLGYTSIFDLNDPDRARKTDSMLKRKERPYEDIGLVRII